MHRSAASVVAIFSTFLDAISCDIVYGMMKTVVYSRNAVDELDALPVAARDQVVAALHRYAMTGHGDVKKLSDREGYRLRAGRYRVIFDEDAQTVIAIKIAKRETTTYRG